MVERCIMIFPEFSNIDVIVKVRERFDPLATHVRPHITLVFPFSSSIESSELKNHLNNALSSIKSLELCLRILHR